MALYLSGKSGEGMMNQESNNSASQAEEKSN